VIGWLRRLLLGRDVPAGFTGTLADDENVLAVAGELVATSLGLWLPSDDGVRRVGWHLISKATWGGGALSVIEATESDTTGGAVLLTDLPARRFVLEEPGTLPRVVQARVTGSIRSRHHQKLPSGGAWFVQRKVPGVDGIVLQVRPDPGTDPAQALAFAVDVADRIRGVG
jgi:hypothetical protein